MFRVRVYKEHSTVGTEKVYKKRSYNLSLAISTFLACAYTLNAFVGIVWHAICCAWKTHGVRLSHFYSPRAVRLVFAIIMQMACLSFDWTFPVRANCGNQRQVQKIFRQSFIKLKYTYYVHRIYARTHTCKHMHVMSTNKLYGKRA